MATNVMFGSTVRTVQDASGNVVGMAEGGRKVFDTTVGPSGGDDSVRIQALIDAASAAGGGTIRFLDGEYTLNIVAKSGVSLVGAHVHASANQSTFRVKFTAATTGVIIDSPAMPASGTSLEGFSVRGILFVGLGAGTPVTGIRIRSARKVFIDGCSFNNIADYAILQDEPTGDAINGTLAIRNCFAQNCLINRTRAALTGVFDLGGSDGLIDWTEVTGSLTASSADGNIAAVVVRGADWSFSNVLVEFADVNLYVVGVNAARLRASNLCSDKSFREAIILDGATDCQISGVAKRSCQGATNTYDGIVLLNSAVRNRISMNVMDLPATAIVPRYAIAETLSSTDTRNKNDFTGCRVASSAYAVEKYYNSSEFGGSAFPVQPAHADVTGATPSVNGAGFVRHTGGVTITDFLDATAGQELFLLVGAATSITSSTTTIRLKNNLSRYFAANSVLHLKNYNGVWHEVCGNSALYGSATYNPDSIASGAQVTTTVTVTGAAIGDYTQASFSLDLGGLIVSSYISAADTATVIFANLTGGAVNLGSGTLRVKCDKA